MATTYDRLMGLRTGETRHGYAERDSILYALSVGMGRDPLDEAELPFVYEGAGLRTVPTQAVVVAHVCGYDPGRIRTVDVRFTALIHPGEDVETHIWVDGDTVSFRSLCPGRGVTVLDHGRCELRPA